MSNMPGPIRRGRFLYVVASNSQPPSGPAGVAGGDKHHYAIAFRVGADGALTQHGPPVLLAARPLHAHRSIQRRISC